jgi:hypothetical protein
MKGQFSLETLFIIGISMMFLIPVLWIFYNYIGSSSDQIVENQVSQFGQQFLDTVNEVYNYGDKALLQAQMTVPERVINMSIEDETLVILSQTVHGEVYTTYPLGVNITGTFDQIDYNPGMKTYEFYCCGGGNVSFRRV